MNETQEAYAVLVVDDEELVRDLTVRAFADAGFECYAAEDADQASRILNTIKIDVLITDLRMPKRHGHALAVEVLQKSNGPAVVVLTAVVEERLSADLRARGAANVFYKPVDYQTFVQEIREIARKHRSERAASSQSESHADTISAGSLRDVALQPFVAIFMKDHDDSTCLRSYLEQHQFQVRSSSSADELYQLLQKIQIDFLVIDDELEGFLQGRDVVERLRCELLRPELILLANADQEELARKMPEVGILPGNSHPEQICRSLQSIQQSIKSTNSLIPHRAVELVQRIEGIPATPQLIPQLAQYLEEDALEILPDEVASLIAQDVRCSAELLRVTNSASLGLRRKVSSLKDAVNLLGVKRAVCISFSLAVSDFTGHGTRMIPPEVARWFQRRSALNANTSAEFSSLLEGLSRDTGFLLGLLQESGVLVLAIASKGRYEGSVIDKLQQTGALMLHTVEKSLFGITHADVSAALLSQWGMPNVFIELVLKQHDSVDWRSGGTQRSKYLLAMQIAEALANLSELEHPTRFQHLDRLLSSLEEVPHSEIQSALERSIQGVQAACELYSLPTPDVETIADLLPKASQLLGEPK